MTKDMLPHGFEVSLEDDLRNIWRVTDDEGHASFYMVDRANLARDVAARIWKNWRRLKLQQWEEAQIKIDIEVAQRPYCLLEHT